MAKKKMTEQVYDDGSYVVKKDSKLVKALSFLICVLIAFVIWIYVANVAEEKQQNIPDVEDAVNGESS